MISLEGKRVFNNELKLFGKIVKQYTGKNTSNEYFDVDYENIDESIEINFYQRNRLMEIKKNGTFMQMPYPMSFIDEFLILENTSEFEDVKKDIINNYKQKLKDAGIKENIKPVIRACNALDKKIHDEIAEQQRNKEAKVISRFSEKQYPSNYNDILHQEHYILRYLYAYSYEYYEMYKDLLKNISSSEIKKLSFLSIGCGTRIDAWSLERVLFENKYIQIKYDGVDVVSWDNRYIPKTLFIENNFINKSASDYFNELEILNYDVYTFAKSIGDMKGDFEKVIKCFKNLPNDKKKFYILTSMISYDDSNRTDQDSLDKLVKTIEAKGYSAKIIVKGQKSDKKIADDCSIAVDYPIPYMDHIKSYITGQYPMLSTKYYNYIIYEFNKE